jgi:hypothetical protein
MRKLLPLLIFPAAQTAATGRPSLRTPEVVTKMCASIRENGHRDTHAAALAGVSSSAVSRWRQEDEEFALQLDTARAEYLEVRLKEIREMRKRDGSLDWRAQAWLLQVAAPEVYGPPSRRHSLARDREEKQRAEEKAQADDPRAWSTEDQAQLIRWRRYSVEKMDGKSEEEARWLGHFTLDPSKPAFPGSLAVAGAVIPPEPELTPEQQAQLDSLRERRRVAHAATAKRNQEMGRAPRNTTILPESPAAAPGEASPGVVLRTPGGDVATEPDLPKWHAHVEGLMADRAPENRANLPESPAGQGEDSERLAHRQPGVSRSAAPRRPLAGAALVAVEAKEWRRVNRLMEEQWERATDRALWAAEEANRDAIPGMRA